ncbi:hypothetical protein [Stenoxybacter acetivorans]|uniref:hypothetical protein n=1 Tax=Stenoxybacter acetivorans TaxID=422441 RepID=UPI0012EB0EFE|nr:hypothetical protein [Stenoxybacter acetivorans]
MIMLQAFFKRILAQNTIDFDLELLRERVEGEFILVPPEAMKNGESMLKWLESV